MIYGSQALIILHHGEGAHAEYHNEDLNELIRSVDFVSMHTYAFHDTHYNPSFWNLDDHTRKSKTNKISSWMQCKEH